jgi:hypothetical protein
MNRAITFCAIVVGIPAVTCAAVSNYMRTHSVLPGIHADNGLECTMDTKYKGDAIPGLPGLKLYYNIVVWHIEFLLNNKFRVVDEKAANDILANDYIGTMTTTDTTYTFVDPIVWTEDGTLIRKNISDLKDFSGLVVNRLTTKVYEHYTEDKGAEFTITGWCTPAYVPPRPIPKKL